MSDHDALIAAILANAGEDTPRLMLADWLEEHGGYEGRLRASFIRTRHTPAFLTFRKYRKAAERPWVRYARSLFRGSIPATWHPWLVPSPGTKGWYRGGNYRSWQDRCVWSFRHPRPVVCAIRHGFVSHIALHPWQFFARAKNLFSAMPIEEVGLLRCVPSLNRYGGYRWGEGGTPLPDGSSLPDHLFRLLDGGEVFFSGERRYDFRRWREYPSYADALAALSRACVKYGRAQAARPT